VPKDNEHLLIGKKMGDTVDGSLIGLEGYGLRITGLSDKTGAPSRKEIEFSRKAFVLLSGGPGIRDSKKGRRVRRLIRGNTISVDTEQVNTVIEQYGAKGVDEIFPKKAPKEAEKKGE
jgi:small subunit ribosomal protein S6e